MFSANRLYEATYNTIQFLILVVFQLFVDFMDPYSNRFVFAATYKMRYIFIINHLINDKQY